MRLALLILPFLLAANPASAEHDRHHRSVPPLVSGEVRLEAALTAPPAVKVSEPALMATPTDERKPERPRVRVVLPSPFAP